MDIKGLEIFIEVAELGSFTKAGDKLGYSQPTISFQIKQLEAEGRKSDFHGFLVGQVLPGRKGGTLYTRLGDVPLVCCGLFLLGTVGFLRFRKRRRAVVA